ncbi:MAG: helix-turn-helix domain-containing protein [Burkholderiales bacterium]|nr:helix-turn-helix domain-containing protein [Burkholderiales bacterium]
MPALLWFFLVERGGRFSTARGAAVGVAVLYHATNLRVRTRTQEGLLGYVTFGPQACGTVNGIPVRAGLMLAASPNTEARFVVDAQWESMTFLVRAENVRAHLEARGRQGEFRVPHRVEMLEANTGRTPALFEWGKRLVGVAVRQPVLLDAPRSRIAAEAELFDALLMALDTTGPIEPHRVDAVRQALLEGTQGTTTVSAEALNWGFWHFGEFSRAYKACFGELPSDTLRRKLDPPDEGHDPPRGEGGRHRFRDGQCDPCTVAKRGNDGSGFGLPYGTHESHDTHHVHDPKSGAIAD